MVKPAQEDYPEYFGKYINLVSEDNLLQAFKNQQPKINEMLHSISEEQSQYAYAPGKWTIKELLQHIIDGERIFNYRALCFARKETASLPSFDENLYAQNANANARDWQSLTAEFFNVRISTEDLYNSFTQEMFQYFGIASDKKISVASIGFITIGHLYHHINIIQERYL